MAPGQPFYLRLMKELLAYGDDADREFLLQGETGLPVGVLSPVPRTRHMYEEQSSRRLEDDLYMQEEVWRSNYIQFGKGCSIHNWFLQSIMFFYNPELKYNVQTNINIYSNPRLKNKNDHDNPSMHFDSTRYQTLAPRAQTLAHRAHRVLGEKKRHLR